MGTRRSSLRFSKVGRRKTQSKDDVFPDAETEEEVAKTWGITAAEEVSAVLWAQTFPMVPWMIRRRIKSYYCANTVLPLYPQARLLQEFRKEIEAVVGPLRPVFGTCHCSTAVYSHANTELVVHGRADKYYMRRFLRARQHDLARAKDMFLAHLKWRQEAGVDTILDDFHFHVGCKFAGWQK